MSDLSVTNTFQSGDVVSAANFNTNYSDIVTYINNRNSGSATWDSMSVSHATNVPLIANNSTGTQDIAQFKDNGTIVGEIFNGGIITLSGQSFGRATLSGTQIFTAGVLAKVVFATTSSTNGEFDATGKFTAPSQGVYSVSSFIGPAGVLTTTTVYIYKNGSEVSRAVYIPTAQFSGRNYGVRDILKLNTSDTLEIYALILSGPTTIDSTSYFSVIKLS